MNWKHLLGLLTMLLLFVKLIKAIKSIGLGQRAAHPKPRAYPSPEPSNIYPPVVVAGPNAESRRPAVERVHFPRTTAGQRQLLFQSWQASGNVSQACRQAHVSRGTFYKWLPRFEKGGYEALQQFACSTPKQPARTSTKIEQQVINLRREHPGWGKQKVSNELARQNNWVAVVSPNTVRRILQEADLWVQAELATTPKGPAGITRTAEIPGQSLNIDLCFVPASHEIEAKLPAVSGSSGRLVIKYPPAQTTSQVQYPGRIFEDDTLSYETAMKGFVAASQADSTRSEADSGLDLSPAAALKAEKRAIRQEEEVLRLERRQIRQQRQAEETDWQAFRQQRRTQQAALTDHKQALSLPQSSTPATQTATSTTLSVSHPNDTPATDQPFITDQLWRQQKSQRRKQLEHRHQQDQLWRQKRQSIRQRLATLPLITSWFAILVIIDNCTLNAWACPYSSLAHMSPQQWLSRL